MKHFCWCSSEADVGKDRQTVETLGCGRAINLHRFNKKRQEPICEIYVFCLLLSNMNEEQTYLGSNDDNAKFNQSGKLILTGLSLQFKSHKELPLFCHVNSIPDHNDLHRTQKLLNHKEGL